MKQEYHKMQNYHVATVCNGGLCHIQKFAIDSTGDGEKNKGKIMTSRNGNTIVQDFDSVTMDDILTMASQAKHSLGTNLQSILDDDSFISQIEYDESEEKDEDTDISHPLSRNINKTLTKESAIEKMARELSQKKNKTQSNRKTKTETKSRKKSKRKTKSNTRKKNSKK